jgi:hypothetical protein
MDHSVSLDRLPEGLRFPPEFDGRIRHDDARRTLIFRGFMSKAEFDKLSRLHDDWGYRRRLEELFRLCTPDPEPQPINRLSAVFARLMPHRDRTGV